jgi:hypothetical protein
MILLVEEVSSDKKGTELSVVAIAFFSPDTSNADVDTLRYLVTSKLWE